MDGLDFEYSVGILTAKLSGELDHHMASGVRQRIDDEFFAKRPLKLKLDLSGVNFMDSSGLGLIMGRYARAKAADCPFVICGVDDRCLRMLKLSGMDKLIKCE